VKDYDMVVGNRPEDWRRQFDLSSWGLISARIAGQRVGGVVIAAKSRELHLLEGRDDLALLWDIRVAPSVRRRGIGATLFAAAERWAGGRGCLQLKVETQNTNVAACKFYASRGCELGAVQRFAYPDFPAEIQLLWYKVLGNRE
jgi:GNAT superfamily N-acetyltransferase